MKTFCIVCGKELNLKPSRIRRVKHGISCSKKCFYIRQKKFMIGKRNHQFGLKGKLNFSFKNGIRINSQGYVLIYLPKHSLTNCDGYYREHRFIIENNYNIFSKNSFENINGTIVLKKEYDIHHINGNKTTK